jgi:LPS-assembly protein
MVRWFILILAGAALIAQTQVASGASSKSHKSTQAKPKAKPAKAPPSPDVVEVLGLRVSPALRPHRLTNDEIPTYMEADRMDGDPDSNVTLTGNSQVRRIDTVIKGDSITYRKAAGLVDSTGNARLMRGGGLMTGPAMQYNVDTESGQMDKPDFWLGATGGFAKAEHADMFSSSTMRMETVTYSGCACDKPSWYIKAKSVDLDFDENEGVAQNGVLYFKDTPILASPYLTFPIKKERKSGFLLPTYGASSRSGLDFTLPYYFNLAPNYDLTLTPRIQSKRGEQLGADFRYLGPTYSGILAGTYLPSDVQTGQSRWMYLSQHSQTLGNGFYTSWNVSGVSDNDYFRDFSTLGLNEASTTYLPKQGLVGWAGGYWNTSVQVYKYQTLQDPDAPIAPPYDKVPELSVHGGRYDWYGFDTELDATATRFSRPEFQGNHLGPDGDRMVLYPTIAFPIVKPGWFITPKVGLHMTQYQSTNWYGLDPGGLPTTQNFPSSESRTLPIMSLDAGMVFERDTSLFGKAATQTLEPRLYYLRVPYRDQSKLPVYDTTLANFSFSQAFEDNIYTGGWDRISNANQLTAALTTRWLDPDTGFERMSLSAGQQLYFQDQLVTLPGETPRTDVRSDYLVAASAALTDTLSTDLAAQYNPYDRRWSQGLIAARWAPQRATSISVSYRYQRDPPVDNPAYAPQGQNQISVAFQWPFSNRWSGVGRVDYSLRFVPQQLITTEDQVTTPRVTQAIAGLEYKGDCCWTGRMVFQRYAVSATDVNNAVFFQLELTGLGALGTDPLKLLNKSIPGYQSVNPPPGQGTTYERYE